MKQSTPPTIGLLTPVVWSRLSDCLKLSPREVEIARGVVEDQKEFAIARRLAISTHTVHTHLERLYRKLVVSSRVQLVVKLAELQLALTSEADSPLPPMCGNRSAGRCPFARPRRRERSALKTDAAVSPGRPTAQ